MRSVGEALGSRPYLKVLNQLIIVMLKITSPYALVRILALWAFCAFSIFPTTLWAQQEAQAAYEPLVLNSQSGRARVIPQGKSITVSGFPDNRFTVRGRLLGVSKDHLHILTSARGSERAAVKIDDIGRVSQLRIGWLILGAILLLYLGGFAIGILLALAASSAGAAAVVAFTVLFLLIFGIPTFFAIKAGFRVFNMPRWKILHGR